MNTKPENKPPDFRARVKFLMKQQNLAYESLDSYESGARRELEQDRDITPGNSAKIARAVWGLCKNPGKAALPKEQLDKVPAFWINLGKELNTGQPLPPETDLDTFVGLFCERLGVIEPTPPKIDSPGWPRPLSDAELLERFSLYLGAVADKCWQLVTRGIIEDNTNPLRLGQVYVSLDTKTPRPRRKDEPEAIREKESRLTALEALFETENDPPTRRVVLVGEPGSGKSTFLQFVTLCLTYRHSRAQGELAKKHFADLEKRVPKPLRDQKVLPFRVILREFAPWLGSRTGTADEVVNYLKAPLATLGYDDVAGKLPEALERGLAFVLFDGLDEVPKSQVSVVKQAITTFAEGRFQKCRVAVTCRTESYKKREFELRGFLAPHEIAPLSFEQQKEFVQDWYEELEQVQPQFHGQGTHCAAKLIEALASDRLRDMAGNPFFLTAMANLHRPDKPLPDTGAKLMNALVNSVLEESRRKQSAADGDAQAAEPELPALLKRAAITLEDLRSILERIAFKTREKRQDQNSRFVDEALLLHELAFSVAVKPEEWLDALRHRAGLLQAQDGRNFEFAYRFEEFLAGCYLAKSSAWFDNPGNPNLANFHVRVLDVLRRQGDYARQVVLWSAGYMAHVQLGERVKVIALVLALLPTESDETGARGFLRRFRRKIAVPKPDLFQLELAADIARDARLETWMEHIERGKDNAVHKLRGNLEQVRASTEHFDVKTRSRAASAIGRLGDLRNGVGRKDGLPDIDWVQLPAGEFKLGEKTGTDVEVKEFKLSRYPVTVAQYQAFVDAGGNGEKRFWDWNTEDAGMLKWWRKNKDTGPLNYDPVFQTPNHPRVGVCWYEAAAFCRWLSEKSKQQIRLPHENQWEWAARWNKETQQADDRPYPWGGPKKGEDEREHLSRHCNWHYTGLGHTSAVGLFPSGKADCGAMDLSGNVWEWCENWYDERETESRVLRGGAWVNDDPEALRAAYRYNFHPGYRLYYCGFRVVLVGG